MPKLIDRLDRALRRRVVGAQRLDGVADELEADRLRFAGRDRRRRCRRGRANSPCSSAGSSRLIAGLDQQLGEIVRIDLVSRLELETTALSSRAGAVTRGSSAAADATTTRAVPVADRMQRPRARGRHAEVRRQAAIRIDLHATETAAPPLAAASRALRAPRGRTRRRRRQLLEVGVGRHDVRTRLAAAPRAAATASAFAAGVSPLTRSRPGRSSAAAGDGRLEQGAKVE